MKVLLQFALLSLLTFPVAAQQQKLSVSYIDTMSFTQENLDLLDQKIVKVYYDRRYEETLPLFKAMWDRGAREYAATQESMAYRFLNYGKATYAQWLTLLGRYDEGIPLFEEALTDTENYFGPIMRLSYAYVGLGLAYSQFGDPYRALWAQNQAARIVDLNIKPGDPSYHLVGNTLGNLARVYADLKQPDKAIKLFEDAEKAYRTAGTEVGIISTFYGRGKIAALSGNLELAREYMRRAHKVQEGNNHGDVSLMKIYWHDALIEKEAGDLGKALQYYAAAEAAIEKELISGNRLSGAFFNGATEIRLSYAELLFEKGDVAKAKELVVSGKAVHAQATSDENNIEGLNFRLLEARIAAAEDDLVTVAGSIERVIAILTNQTEVDWLRPEMDSIMQTSSPLLARAFRLSAEIQDAAGIYSTGTILANCSAGKAMLRKIQVSYAPDVTMDRLFEENASLFDLSVEKAYVEASNTRSKESIENYFSAIEEARDQQLLTSIDTREEVAFGLPDELKEAEGLARQRLRSYERLLTYEQGKAVKNADLIYSYQTYLRSSRNAMDSISAIIEESFPEYYNLKFRERPVRLSEVQKKLIGGEAMMCYYVASSGVYAIMITDEEVVPFKSELSEQLIMEFNETLLRPSSTADMEWQERSFTLYEQLLGPLNTRAIKRLIVIPDRSLSFMAWPALLTAKTGSAGDWRSLPYLIRSLSLSQESSAGVYVNQHGRRNIRRELTYAGFAPDYRGEVLSIRGDSSKIGEELFFPGYARQFPGKLVYNGEEVKRASSLFISPVAEIGVGATESYFKKVAGSASILHVASHGITSAYDPAASHLVFSTSGQYETEDGRLHAWEIYDMDLPVDLTVLSACQTGQGALRTGTGVLSLARAFRYAGSKDVVMSLWSVNDRSTYQLMTEFFTGIEKKQDKAGALRGAMVRHLETEKNAELTHPYYWAGFSLVGPGEVLDTGQRPMLWMWGGLVALFSLVVFWWRGHR